MLFLFTCASTCFSFLVSAPALSPSVCRTGASRKGSRRRKSPGARPTYHHQHFSNEKGREGGKHSGGRCFAIHAPGGAEQRRSRGERDRRSADKKERQETNCADRKPTVARPDLIFHCVISKGRERCTMVVVGGFIMVIA